MIIPSHDNVLPLSVYVSETSLPSSPCDNDSSLAPLPPVHHMVNRTQTGSLKTKILFSLYVITHSSEEPSCYSKASKEDHWHRAIADEYNALIQKGTWELVPPSFS